MRSTPNSKIPADLAAEDIAIACDAHTLGEMRDLKKKEAPGLEAGGSLGSTARPQLTG
jgi:hypothetical protein